MRAAGGGELHIGRKVEKFTATELADADKPQLLRAYLRNWKFEVGVFFDGVGPRRQRRAAAGHRARLPGLPHHAGVRSGGAGSSRLSWSSRAAVCSSAGV